MKLVIEGIGETYIYNPKTNKFIGDSFIAEYFNDILSNATPWGGDAFLIIIAKALQQGFTIVEYVPYPEPKFPVY